jgi:hypothetical protein
MNDDPTARESDTDMASPATATRPSLDLLEPETPGDLVVQGAAPPPREPRVQVLPAAAPDAKSTAAPTPFASSDDISLLVAALAQAQGLFEQVLKDEEASVQSRREGARSYNYDYASLAAVLKAVRPHLSAAGIALIQAPVAGQSAVRVITFLGHSSGQWMRNELAIGITATDAQTIGSAITYARRYALMSLLGVAPEDDDDGAQATQTRDRRPDAGNQARPGQGPVTMPQRAQPTSPQSGASAGAPRAASPDATASTAAPPRPASGTFTIAAIEPRQKKDKTPYWVVAFSHGLVACTFRQKFAEELAEAKQRGVTYVDAVTTQKGDWLFLDSLQPSSGGDR